MQERGTGGSAEGDAHSITVLEDLLEACRAQGGSADAAAREGRTDADAAAREGRTDADAAAREGRTDADAAAREGRYEFQEAFVTLVNPAGLLDMEWCGAAAGRMRDAAVRSGYGAGAKMSSLLADVFAAMADIAGRPVGDGALGHAEAAHLSMMRVLCGAARAYRDWRDAEPIADLEDAKRAIERQISMANWCRDALSAAGGHRGPIPVVPGGTDAGRTCGDVIREEQEGARARAWTRGYDPVLPRLQGEVYWDGDTTDMSGTEYLAMMRGNIPDDYELVRIRTAGE